MKDAKGHGSDPRGGSNEFDKGPLVPGYTSRGAQLLQATMRKNPNPPIVEVPAHSTGVQQVGQPVSMQRRQYEAIAGAINRLPTDISYAKGNVAQHFADALKGTNPNFDAGKFKTAATTGNMGRTQNKEPGMQSRHYEAVAGAIATLPPTLRGSVATHFAGELGRKNSNFNSQRFIKAAGG